MAEDKVYAFGNGNDGQLGYGSEETNLRVPTLIPSLNQRLVLRKIVCSVRHCLAISDLGEIWSWGSNDKGQLGREGRQSTPQPIDALQTFAITDIACGEDFSLAVTEAGRLFSWGANDKGQLGLGDREQKSRPRPLKGLDDKIFVRVSCGTRFSVALTNAGEVYCWGDNFDAQLGNGTVVSSEVPKQNEWLRKKAVPVIDIQCGDAHVLALSASGNVFSWGSNRFGQLGHGDNVSRSRPELIKTLRRMAVCRIACGANHSAAVTVKGVLWTCGAGGYGQLGHGDTTNESSIHAVPELANVVSVACGRAHTVAIVEEGDPTPGGKCRRALYLCGSSGGGQLGLADGLDKHSAFVRNHAIVPAPGEAPIRDVIAGGDVTFVICSSRKSLIPTPLMLSSRTLENPTSPTQTQRTIEIAFSSAPTLNSSFLHPELKYKTSQDIPALDLEDYSKFHQLLLASPAPIMNSCGAATARLATALSQMKPVEPESIRFYMLMLLNPLLAQPALNSVVIEKICVSILGLNPQLKITLQNWWSQLSQEYLGTIVKHLQQFLSYCLKTSYGPETPIISSVLVLNLLYQANEKSHALDYRVFYNADVCKNVNLELDYEKWRTSSESVFAYCRYPFLLNPACKAELFKIDAKIQMQHQLRNAFVEALATGIGVPYLVIEVSRENIVEEAMHSLALQTHNILKPLKVIFRGEEGVDEGGVKKEFFQLLVRKLFDVRYGMFVIQEETQTFWFNQSSLENDSEFKLVGCLLGLAIYNSVILDVRFPLVVYKKLLKKPVDLEDLRSIDPVLYENLKKMLAPDFDVSCLDLTFQVSYEYFGEARTHNLVEDGDKKPVTNDNKQLYVDLFVQYKLVHSVARQFDAFAEGFYMSIRDLLLAPDFLRPEELERIICGDPELDLSTLEQATKYNGYTADHPLIQGFWEIIRGMTPEEQRRFLFFVSGSDRVPLQGLKSLNFTIQRSGPDSEFLPAAHTCFNILDLPEYSSVEKLKSKLMLAITHTEGFGLR